MQEKNPHELFSIRLDLRGFKTPEVYGADMRKTGNLSVKTQLFEVFEHFIRSLFLDRYSSNLSALTNGTKKLEGSSVAFSNSLLPDSVTLQNGYVIKSLLNGLNHLILNLNYLPFS